MKNYPIRFPAPSDYFPRKGWSHFKSRKGRGGQSKFGDATSAPHTTAAVMGRSRPRLRGGGPERTPLSPLSCPLRSRTPRPRGCPSLLNFTALTGRQSPAGSEHRIAHPVAPGTVPHPRQPRPSGPLAEGPRPAAGSEERLGGALGAPRGQPRSAPPARRSPTSPLGLPVLPPRRR